MNQWNLTYLFPSKADFEGELQALQTIPSELASYEGQLADEDRFVAYFTKSIEMEKRLSRLYQYAHLASDLNKKDLENMQALMRVVTLLQALSEATSFESPEILSLGEALVMERLAAHPEISDFRFAMEKLFRGTEHVLDKKSELLLSIYRPVSEVGSDLYTALAIADHQPKMVKLKDKGSVEVTQGNWRGLITEASSASERRKIFEAVFSSYEANKFTYAKIYETVMMNQKAYAKSRNYSSILEANLFHNNIPTTVYEQLIAVASKKTKAVKKYLKLRKKALGLGYHYTYDRFLELASSAKKYSYDEAKELFFKSITHCPANFQDKAHQALEDGFVDVYEGEGKTSGAYSSGMPDLHPYILLNYNGTLDDVFTVAHEAGHSIHSLYAQKQPAILQNYTIFVAEIASTFNEHMLLDDLLASDKLSKEEKIMLLQKEIDEIMGTFYRQTLFAQYELEISRMIEQDLPIDHQVLSDVMIRLYHQYYGQKITKEKVKQFVWAYIPHLFHTPFYVYQYATSFAASFKIYHDVKHGVPGAFERYEALLSSGGSEYPIMQTQKAGVDLTKKETFLAVSDRMAELVDELEKYLA